MKTALVTGSAGFVGRHMVKALIEQGYNVVGVDIAGVGHAERCSRPHAITTDGTVEGLNGQTGDAVARYDDSAHWQPWPSPRVDAREFFRRSSTHYDLVVHCAAVVGGRTMIDGAPLLLAVEDLTLDAELFRWAMRTRPGRIIYFSSSAAYPVWCQAERHEQLRLDEWMVWGDGNDFAMPDQTYGWVKLTGERLAAEANAEGIRTHVFRPFSGYGGDQALDYPFPAIVKRAIEHPKPKDNAVFAFDVWGHPGSARDWVHIDDVVGCVLAAIDVDDIGPLNICTGRPTRFCDLAEMALQAAGHERRGYAIRGDMSKPTGVFWRVGDPTRMRQVYTPKITIEEGIERAMKELQ